MDRSWDLQIPPELSGPLPLGQELGSMKQRAGGPKESKQCQSHGDFLGRSLSFPGGAQGQAGGPGPCSVTLQKVLLLHYRALSWGLGCVERKDQTTPLPSHLPGVEGTGPSMVTPALLEQQS